MRTYGKDLPEFFATLRRDKNLTLEGLGAKLGVTKQYLNAVERGRYPSVPLRLVMRVMKLCDKDRRGWLEDLLLEACQERVLRRASGVK